MHTRSSSPSEILSSKVSRIKRYLERYGRPVGHYEKKLLRRSSSHALICRTKKDQDFIKTCMYAGEYTDFFNTEIVNNELQESVPSHRPVEEFLFSTPTKRRPIIAVTPGGTKLYRESDYGDLMFFSNSIMNENVAEIQEKTDDDVLKKKLYPPAENYVRSVEIDITHELINKAFKENKKTINRKPSQQQAIVTKGKASAQSIVSLFTPCIGKKEIAHIIARSIIGNRKAQRYDNFGITSKDANTAMLLFESQIPFLRNSYAGNIKLKVTFEYKEFSPYEVKSITYDVITDDNKFSFIIRGDLERTPRRVYQKYVHAFFEKIISGKDIKSFRSFDRIMSK